MGSVTVCNSLSWPALSPPAAAFLTHLVNHPIAWAYLDMVFFVEEVADEAGVLGEDLFDHASISFLIASINSNACARSTIITTSRFVDNFIASDMSDLRTVIFCSLVWITVGMVRYIF